MAWLMQPWADHVASESRKKSLTFSISDGVLGAIDGVSTFGRGPMIRKLIIGVCVIFSMFSSQGCSKGYEVKLDESGADAASAEPPSAATQGVQSLLGGRPSEPTTEQGGR